LIFLELEEKIKPIADEAYETFKGEKGWKLYPETVDTLQQLKRLNIRMGVISNNDERLCTNPISFIFSLF